MNITEGIILPLPSSSGMGEQSIRSTPHGAGGRASENSSLYLLCGAEQSCVDIFFMSAQSKVENYLLVGIWVLRRVRHPVTLLAPTGYSGSVCVWRRAGQRSRSSSGEPAGAELGGPSSPLSLSSASGLLVGRLSRRQPGAEPGVSALCRGYAACSGCRR